MQNNDLQVQNHRDMKRYAIIVLAAMAVISSCTKDILLPEKDAPESGAPETPSVVFTATMEGMPASKATLDADARCASWEMNDLISINGHTFIANSAGASTVFSELTEVRPVFVSSESSGFTDAETPDKLVDEAGTTTKWCANASHWNENKNWDIVVKTERPVKLHAINIWNSNDTEGYSNRRWKDVRVSGRNTENEVWTEIKSCFNLDLAVNNEGLAGTLNVDATHEYEYYKVEVLSVLGEENEMQMSDMKFVCVDNGSSQGLKETDAPFKAYFPTFLHNGVTTALPANVFEDWADGKFNMPMYATSTTTDLSFKNLCGVLKITIKSDQIAAVKRIRVRSANKAVSGPFTVDANNAAVLSDASAVANTLTVTYSDAVSTDAAGKVFYVAVPAQTYQALKIELDADGNGFTTSMTTKAATDIKLERNKIYPVTFADNAPTKGTAKATIGGKDIDVNWVQLWAGGPKFAEFNVGAANNHAEDYGGYYCWGKYIDKDPDGNYDTGTTVLSGNRDTATKLWGSNWRMPTIEEFITLANNDGSEKCTCNWVLNYNGTGINGRLFTGKDKYASNSIFFPATGFFNRAKVVDQGIDACYWSSSPGGPQGAHVLYFDSTSIETQRFSERIAGITVRAVLAED